MIGESRVGTKGLKAISLMQERHICVVASGRTDSGVHAYNQVCHIECDEIKDFYKRKWKID